jgi:hypothetical protein
MTADWDEALDAQLDLRRALLGHEGLRWATEWLENTPDAFRVSMFAEGAPIAPREFADQLALSVVAAEPVYVSRAAMPLVLAAVRSWTPEPMWQPSPVGTGCLRLSQPILWDATEIQTIFWGSAAGVYDLGQSVMVMGLLALAQGNRVGTALSRTILIAAPYEKLPHKGEGALARLIQPILRLLDQRVLVRARVPERDVLVVNLRRAATERPPSGGHAVDWSCQWPVSGHWRWQPYPASGEKRQIWIEPYVKGPPDKPLRVHEGRVWKLVR